MSAVLFDQHGLAINPDPDAMARHTAFRAVHPIGQPFRACRTSEGIVGHWAHPNGLFVIESVARERDGRYWLHVSASRRSRLPDWADMKLVREWFIGLDIESYMVFPPEARWVNAHRFALHLWACLDAPDGVLPDFRHLGTI